MCAPLQCSLSPAPPFHHPQVSQLLRSLRPAPAAELLVATAPRALLRGKLERLSLDAGRALCLGLHWEAGLAHLAASPIDPREVIALFPELQVGGGVGGCDF